MNKRCFVGQVFGRLTLLEVVKTNKKRGDFWRCKCDCGKFSVSNEYNLKSGHTKSCGCLKRELLGKASVTHNGSTTRLYIIWQHLKDRCLNPNHVYFASYGGRGITVCEEWKNSFEEFRDWAMLNGYTKELSIDRIDNNSGYRPDNCRWADEITQHNNRRNNVLITYKEDVFTIAQLCKKYNIKSTILRGRLRRGWSVEDALEKQNV